MPFLESTEGACRTKDKMVVIVVMLIMMMVMVLACQERESDVGDVGLHCTSCGGPEGTGKSTFLTKSVSNSRWFSLSCQSAEFSTFDLHNSPPSSVATTLLLELGPGPADVNGETVTEYFENGARPDIIVWGEEVWMVMDWSSTCRFSLSRIVFFERVSLPSCPYRM